MAKISDVGIDQLCEVIAKRADIASVFTDAVLVEQIAELSGGVMRDLMRLVRLSTDTDEDKIGSEDVQFAANTMIREYDRLLRNDDIETLRRIKRARRVQADEDCARLLNLRLILEYQNGERCAGLHPALERISWVQTALGGHD